MDHLQKLRRDIHKYLLAALALQGIIIVAGAWALQQYAHLQPWQALAGSLVLGVLSAWLATRFLGNLFTQPVQALWQAVLHLSPTDHGVSPPETRQIKLGRELVTSLTAQIYQLATLAEKSQAENKEKANDLHLNFIAQNLPLPLIVLDAAENIRFANEAAANYIGLKAEDMFGKNAYMVLDMSFPDQDTFDKWLKGVKNKSATATGSWERVRLNVRDDHPVRLFDLAAYYNRDNPNHHETILVLFDHTKQYSQDDQAVSFMALSVHELRTPLTLLRGYIEVFEDEFGQKITDPELQGFMQKMDTMAEQLTTLVNNILNVARVDDDQLELHLQSDDWADALKSSLSMISLRAKVRGITIKCAIAKDLPQVGIDRLSIREVINNLVDNAIKYSGSSKVIEIKTYLNREGLVETTVQDFGLGIPDSAIPHLFTKFYRDHHNRSQIGGTGLGLYLSKAIVNAHGGNLWVRSREGQGSTFGFTVVPYARLAQEAKASGQQDGDQPIVRGAHGWIKNHSLYRR